MSSGGEIGEVAIAGPDPRILAVVNEATGPLRARDVGEVLDHELLRKNIEGTRAKLKRLAKPDILTEVDTGSFTLARPVPVDTERPDVVPEDGDDVVQRGIVLRIRLRAVELGRRERPPLLPVEVHVQTGVSAGGVSWPDIGRPLPGDAAITCRSTVNSASSTARSAAARR